MLMKNTSSWDMKMKNAPGNETFFLSPSLSHTPLLSGQQKWCLQKPIRSILFNGQISVFCWQNNITGHLNDLLFPCLPSPTPSALVKVQNRACKVWLAFPEGFSFIGYLFALSVPLISPNSGFQHFAVLHFILTITLWSRISWEYMTGPKSSSKQSHLAEWGFELRSLRS